MFCFRAWSGSETHGVFVELIATFGLSGIGGEKEDRLAEIGIFRVRQIRVAFHPVGQFEFALIEDAEKVLTNDVVHLVGLVDEHDGEF